MRQGLILLAPDPAVRHDDLECFGICEVGEDTSVRRHHLLIMRLFREAAEENAGHRFISQSYARMLDLLREFFADDARWMRVVITMVTAAAV